MVEQVVDCICAKFQVDPSSSFDVRAVFLGISRFSMYWLVSCMLAVVDAHRCN